MSSSASSFEVTHRIIRSRASAQTCIALNRTPVLLSVELHKTDGFACTGLLPDSSGLPGACGFSSLGGA